MSDVLVWHRRDLRTVDNPALAAAADRGRPVPVFVVDPAFYDARGLACDARLEFLFESLRDLHEQYRELGADLVLLHGRPRDRLRAVLDGDAEIGLPDGATALHFNREVTHGRARERDQAVAGWADANAFGEDGIVRDDPNPRDDWQRQCETYFEADLHPEPDGLLAHPGESETTLADIRERYEVKPTKEGVPRGGRTAGLARLERFIDTIDEYPGAVSKPAPAERYCSRLSPYLKFGTLSYREVYQRVQAAAGHARGSDLFTSRLFWNRHYTQKLEDFPAATETAINPVFRNLHADNHDPDLVAAWKAGETGFPLVDAAMRALVGTGWINFRLRALIATFFSYVLKQPWTIGADFLYYHLIDADPAINYRQWQNQANLDGVHPVRVYDPAKQAREYDPDGGYIRKYVPELAPLPDAHLPEPAKTPLPLQEECGVEIGTDYPYPVVEYEAEATAARDLYARLSDRATEALYNDPDLLRKASLSQRRRERDGDGDPTLAAGQVSLDEF